MTTRKPRPAAHSEDELLEQWDFLDAMVERQAAALRAGIQDVDEDEEAVVALSELESLRRQLESLRRDHDGLLLVHAALGRDHEALRRRFAALQVSATDDSNMRVAMADRDLELAKFQARLSAVEAGRNALEAAELSARERAERMAAEATRHAEENQELRRGLAAASNSQAAVAAARVDQRRWQERAEALERELEALHRRSSAEFADGAARLKQAEAALARWETTHAEMLTALRGAHAEVETLRTQLARRARRSIFPWRR